MLFYSPFRLLLMRIFAMIDSDFAFDDLFFASLVVKRVKMKNASVTILSSNKIFAMVFSKWSLSLSLSL